MRKEEVNIFYEELLKHPYLVAHKEEYAPFIKYYERQWVGVKQSHRRIRKGDDNISWNCFKQVKDGLLTTTSSLEGWHNQFQYRFGVN